jgi:hypothetical protein
MKLGLFFGAGAEMGYGLPSGGKFAIELFRLDPSEEKQELRKQLQEKINRRAAYGTRWLPPQFWEKNIHAFGKGEFTCLIESSIENRKDDLIRRLGAFDELVEAQFQHLPFGEDEVARAYQERFHRELGGEVYSQVIRLNQLLGDHGDLFGSRYYSAMLDVVRAHPEASLLRRFVIAFLQLLVGSCGHDLISRLNQEIFTQAPDDLPIFDDVSGLFRVEMSKGGLDAIDLLVTEKTAAADATITLQSMLIDLASGALESLFDGILDYQALIDSHFRYLYSPRTEWAKFTKMVIFMRVARRYIVSQMPAPEALPKAGYYHDLAGAAKVGITLRVIGTSNYNSLLERLARELGFAAPPTYHLNGGAADYYNPFTNDVITVPDPEEVPLDQLHVPFILTQSGIKPLTSVSMSRRYVELFDHYLQCDAIASVGFGFNRDDSHINGLFRKLIEEYRKPFYCVGPMGRSQGETKGDLLEKLRLPEACRGLLHPVPVDRHTREVDGKLWIEYLSAAAAAAAS